MLASTRCLCRCRTYGIFEEAEQAGLAVVVEDHYAVDHGGIAEERKSNPLTTP